MQNEYDGIDQRRALERALATLAQSRIPLDALQIEDQSPLGRGGFAIVRRGWWKTRNEDVSEGLSLEVAVKELLPNQHKPLRLALRLMREIHIWSTLAHPNILQFLGFHLDLDRAEAYLISPFIRRGSLRSQSKVSETTVNQRWHWVLGITAGLMYLHTRSPPIVHGDIKADNVLLSDDDEAVLCDFGVSTIVEESVSSGLTTSNGLKSSIRWCAPELFHGESPSLASDVWAWGLTILEAMTGRVPHEDCKTEAAILMRILGAGPSRGHYPELADEHELWDIAAQCWNKDLAQRIRMEQCHDLLKSCRPRISQVIPPYQPLQAVPSPRPATEITRKRPKYSRSKLGCLSCRVRKVKCDEKHPICTRCARSQRECTWPTAVPTSRKKVTPSYSEPVPTSRPSTWSGEPSASLLGMGRHCDSSALGSAQDLSLSHRESVQDDDTTPLGTLRGRELAMASTGGASRRRNTERPRSRDHSPNPFAFDINQLGPASLGIGRAEAERTTLASSTAFGSMVPPLSQTILPRQVHTVSADVPELPDSQTFSPSPFTLAQPPILASLPALDDSCSSRPSTGGSSIAAGLGGIDLDQLDATLISPELDHNAYPAENDFDFGIFDDSYAFGNASLSYDKLAGSITNDPEAQSDFTSGTKQGLDQGTFLTRLQQSSGTDGGYYI